MANTSVFWLKIYVKQRLLDFFATCAYTQGKGGEVMGWLLIPLLILVAIIGAAVVRGMNTDYTIGSGMFQNSEYNLDEIVDISDKEYYNKDGWMK